MTYYLNFEASGKFERCSLNDPPELPFEVEDALELVIDDGAPAETVEALKDALVCAYLFGGSAHEVLANSCFCEGPCVPMGFFEGGHVDALCVSVEAASAEQ